jgi:hypothetical protein
MQQRAPAVASYAQQAQTAAALPQSDFTKVGRRGKAEKKPSEIEPIKRTLLWDERMVVFKRAADAPQITPETVTSVMAHINIALSKVAPPPRPDDDGQGVSERTTFDDGP